MLFTITQDGTPAAQANRYDFAEAIARTLSAQWPGTFTVAAAAGQPYTSFTGGARDPGPAAASAAAWTIHPAGPGQYAVTSPDGTAYEVAAHYEPSQSPVPEEAVRIDQVTSGGKVLHDGRRVLAAFDAQVTMLAEDAVLRSRGDLP